MRHIKKNLRLAKDGLVVTWHGLAPWARPLYPLALVLIGVITLGAVVLLCMGSNEAKREWLI